MELTPRLLETQQFPEKFRGYDCDAVDDFLERVGVGVADLQTRLREADAKVDDLQGELATASPGAPAVAPAPQQVAPVPASARAAQVDTDQVSRALILAQQAADQAIAEANVEAERLKAAAVAESAQTRSEAERDAKTMAVEAQATLDGAKARVAALEERAMAEAKVECERLLAEASEKAELEAARRRAELKMEIDELDSRLVERRRDAVVLTDVVTTRRSQIGDIARELDRVSERLEEFVDQPAGVNVSVPDPVEEADSSTDTVPELLDLAALETEDDVTDEPQGDSSEWTQSAREGDRFGDHPAGSETPAGQNTPRWATADDEPAGGQRPDLHVVDDRVAPAAVPSDDADPQMVPAAQVATPVAPALAEAPANTPLGAAVARTGGAPAPRGFSDDMDEALEDPFLAALRGHEPLDGEDFDETTRRRRRRRW